MSRFCQHTLRRSSHGQVQQDHVLQRSDSCEQCALVIVNLSVGQYRALARRHTVLPVGVKKGFVAGQHRTALS
jgi:hypothetical protein